jgi:hypothetical protein
MGIERYIAMLHQMNAIYRNGSLIERRYRTMFDEFNRQQNETPVEANWEGWTPPWMSEEGHGPRGPRGWQGPRGPFGPGFGPGRGFGGPRGPFGHGHGHGFGGPRGPFGPGRQWGIPDEVLALRAEAAEIARLFAIASRGAFEDKERISQLRAFLDRSHKELSDMIYGSAQGQATNEGQHTSTSTDVEQA